MAVNNPYRNTDELPMTLAAFPLPGCILLPRAELPLNIFEPRFIAMVDDALKAGHRLIGMVQPRPDCGRPNRPTLSEVGCCGRITRFAETGDGRYLITLTGIARFRLNDELDTTTPYRQCAVDFAEFAADLAPCCGGRDIDGPGLLTVVEGYLRRRDIQFDRDALSAAPLGPLVNSLAMMVPWNIKEKQALLEAPTLRQRAELLVALAQKALATGGVQ